MSEDITTGPLIDRFVALFGCDTARITKPMGTLFLILGWKRHTKDNPRATWYRNGKPYHFKYLEEKCIASGSNEVALIESAEFYKRLCDAPKEEGWKLLFDKWKGRQQAVISSAPPLVAVWRAAQVVLLLAWAAFET